MGSNPLISLVTFVYLFFAYCSIKKKNSLFYMFSNLNTIHLSLQISPFNYIYIKTLKSFKYCLTKSPECSKEKCVCFLIFSEDV